MTVATKQTEASVSKDASLRAALVYVRCSHAESARPIDLTDAEPAPWVVRTPIKLAGVRKIMLNV